MTGRPLLSTRAPEHHRQRWGQASTRGQAGVDKLLVFIVAIAAVLVLVPAAFGLAGFDIRDGSFGGTETPAGEEEELEDGSLIVLSSFGSEINDDRTSVGVVELLVTASGEPVDLDDVTVTWDGTQRFVLTPTHVGAGDGSFGVETLHNETVLSGPGEKAFLRFDLGSDDIGGLQRFGERLEPGDEVTVTLTTGDGVETTETVTVPDPLPPGSAVRFG